MHVPTGLFSIYPGGPGHSASFFLMLPASVPGTSCVARLSM
jgi:hypothetical protein